MTLLIANGILRKGDRIMYTDEYIKLHTLMEIDLSGIDEDDYFGNGMAIIHLSADGVYVLGLHYVEDEDFEYTDYIPENDIGENDMIMYGKVEDYKLKVIDLLK